MTHELTDGQVINRPVMHESGSNKLLVDAFEKNAVRPSADPIEQGAMMKSLGFPQPEIADPTVASNSTQREDRVGTGSIDKQEQGKGSINKQYNGPRSGEDPRTGPVDGQQPNRGSIEHQQQGTGSIGMQHNGPRSGENPRTGPVDGQQPNRGAIDKHQEIDKKGQIKKPVERPESSSDLNKDLSEQVRQRAPRRRR